MTKYPIQAVRAWGGNFSLILERKKKVFAVNIVQTALFPDEFAAFL